MARNNHIIIILEKEIEELKIEINKLKDMLLKVLNTDVGWNDFVIEFVGKHQEVMDWYKQNNKKEII